MESGIESELDELNLNIIIALSLVILNVAQRSEESR